VLYHVASLIHISQFVSQVVRHRIDEDGGNTSWALVTMREASEVDAALVDAEELAARFNFKVARFEQKLAATSSGAMSHNKALTALWKSELEGPLSLRRDVQRTMKLAQHGASQTVADATAVGRMPTLREVHVGGYFSSAFFTNSGHNIITAGDDRQVIIHDIRTGEKRVLLERTISITVATMSPDGALLAVGDDSGQLGVYSLGNAKHDQSEPNTNTSSVVLPSEATPRTKLRTDLTPAAGTGLQLAWDPVDFHSTIMCAGFSVDGQLLATLCEDGHVEVRAAQTGLGPRGIAEQPMVLDFHGGAAPVIGHRTLCFSADYLAVAGGGSPSTQVQLWDVATLEKVRAIEFSEQVLSIALRKDGLEAAVGFATGAVQVVRMAVAKYTALKSQTIRQTSDVSSLKVGRLALGDVVVCVDSRPGPQGSGITRIFIGDGWVNDYHKNGTKLLEKTCNDAQLTARNSTYSTLTFKSCRRIQHSARSDEERRLHLRMERFDKGRPEADKAVMSVAYSHNGDYLAIGKHSGTFLLYDTKSAACVATYDHGSSRGMCVVFSPASDKLALGGGHFQSAVIHQLQPPALMHRYQQVNNDTMGSLLVGLHANITCACVSFNYAAVSTGSHIRLINRHDLNDRVLIATDQAVRAHEEPIALRNGATTQVAAVVAAKSVIVYSKEGELVYQLPGLDAMPWDGECRGVAWSFDGQWLYAWGGFGVRVHDANDGTYRYHFADHNSITRDCEIDPTSRYILTAGTSRCVLIRDLHSEKTIHNFIEDGITGPCTFDHMGERVAYFDRGRGTTGGKIVIRDVLSGKEQRTYEGVKASAQIKFSPGNSDYLLCVDFSGQLTVLNTREGLPDCPIWGGLLRSMALPGGHFCRFAVGWAPAHSLWIDGHQTVWVGGLPQTVADDPSELKAALAVFGTVVSVTVRQKEGELKSWALASFDSAVAARRAASTGSIELAGAEGSVTCRVEESHTGEMESRGQQRGGTASVAARHSNKALVLYAGIDTELCIVDVHQFSLSVVEDATFTPEQLIALTENAPDQIKSVSRRFPDSVNRRHTGRDTDILKTGDTVLHYCARHGKADAMSEWLYGSAVYEPVANLRGHTALHDAILTHNSRMIRQLFQQITGNLNEKSGPLLTASLKLLAEETPELVLECLDQIESCAMQQHHTFRTYAHRREVLGVSTLAVTRPEHLNAVDGSEEHSEESNVNLLKAVTKDTVRGLRKTVTKVTLSMSTSTKNDADSGKEIWAELLPSTDKAAKEILMASKVLCLTDFIGAPENSPYHAIVERCDANVFESKLMRLATQFKWERNCRRRIHLQMMSYAACMILASFAMAASALHGPRVQFQIQYSTNYGTSLPPAIINLLQGSMVAAEIVSVSNEWMQVSREGFGKYISVWNILDLTGSCLLIVGAAGHFTMNDTWIQADWRLEFIRRGVSGENIVRSAGSLGVAIKWLGFLDYLRSLDKTTGPIIRMIAVIINDMRSFLMILGLVFTGMIFFMVINMPWHDAHRYQSQPGSMGALWPAVGMFRLVIFGDVDDEAFSQSFLGTVLLLLYAFFVIILMMNLCESSRDKANQPRTPLLCSPWALTIQLLTHVCVVCAVQ
jgi:WD40 repeat protein